MSPDHFVQKFFLSATGGPKKGKDYQEDKARRKPPIVDASLAPSVWLKQGQSDSDQNHSSCVELIQEDLLGNKTSYEKINHGHLELPPSNADRNDRTVGECDDLSHPIDSEERKIRNKKVPRPNLKEKDSV